jgi:glucosamine 6-phosphate synthetase-like amidotransferase/phosphosugar isomerase protein
VALVDELSRIPGKIGEVLRQRDGECRLLARSFASASHFLYLGRGIHFPIALEGALKLIEISSILQNFVATVSTRLPNFMPGPKRRSHAHWK